MRHQFIFEKDFILNVFNDHAWLIMIIIIQNLEKYRFDHAIKLSNVVFILPINVKMQMLAFLHL